MPDIDKNIYVQIIQFKDYLAIQKLPLKPGK